MTMLLAITALSLDASFMYDKRNKLYSAADGAAKSGAIELNRNSTVTIAQLENFARHEVAAHGFTPVACGASGGVSVCVNHPPASGGYAGDTDYVEAIVSESTPTFFARVFQVLTMTPGARAVAGTGPSTDCLVSLNGISLATTAELHMPGCSLETGGNLATGNNTVIDSQSVGYQGVCTGRWCPGNSEDTNQQPSDPLAGHISPPIDPGGCVPASVANSATLTLTAKCYSSITMGNNSNLYFGPGTYYIKGPIVTGNSPRICLNPACTFDYSAGIMIYLTGAGSINLPNGSFMRLNAQTSGPYNGILFYQDPADHNAATFNNGSATYDLSGALYFPGATLSYGNNGSTNDCALVVANFYDQGNGRADMTNTCAHYGGSPIQTVSLSE
jgi:hypothetical protein